MQISTANYLRYIYQSLADTARLSPSLKEAKDIVEVSYEEIREGLLSGHSKSRLFGLAKQPEKEVSDTSKKENSSPINVVVIPAVYSLRPEHGQVSKTLPQKIAPLLLFGKLTVDGCLRPEENPECQAVLARDLLEPNRLDVSIGTIESADAVYAMQKGGAENWLDVLRKGFSIVEQVSGQSYEMMEIDGYKRLGYGYVLLADRPSATQSILRLVDLLRTSNSKNPLLDALLVQAPSRNLLSVAQQLDMSLQHLGQMECAYGLSASQREALAHYLAGQTEVSILAVDGPPETGKTTLLLSVIATLWVKHALEQKESPIIVATSTNNQAVTNILQAFAKVKETTGSLSGRWLSVLQSYGLYLPARTREQDIFDFPVHRMKGIGKEAKFDAQQYENRAGLYAAREDFLNNFKKAFSVEESIDLSKAIEYLHTRLRDEVSVIIRTVGALKTLSILIGEQDISDSAIERCFSSLSEICSQYRQDIKEKEVALRAARQLHADWAQHLHAEPWWIALQAMIGLNNKRHQRDRVFCAQALLNQSVLLDDGFTEFKQRSDIEQVIAQLINERRNECESLQNSILEAEEKVAKLRETCDVLRPLQVGNSINIEVVQAALDKGARHMAFKLATHYWEARYLIQLQEHFSQHEVMRDNKSPKNLLAQYQRLAKLHPCFVCTLYTLPNKFIAWRSKDESSALCNSIDLLIMDEAGQVSAEVGAASFALAKRALVVGDVNQIEPVWAVPERIDNANAEHSGLVASNTQWQDLKQSGMTASF